MTQVHNGLARLQEVQRGAKVAFALDSGEGGLERLSESIQVVKDFWRYPEDAYLRGARICQGALSVPAGGAGNYSAASVSLQQDGWICHVIDLWIGMTANSSAIMKRGLPLPNSVGNNVFRDMRAPTSGPVTTLRYVNNVAAAPGGTSCGIIRVLANTSVHVPVDWVLVNGGPVATETALVIYNSTANEALDLQVRWIERQLLPGELFK